LTGTYTGGSVILEYDIFWDQGSIINTWDLLITLPATGASTFSHIQAAGISEGLTYQFRYAARNFYGTSSSSTIISILAATVPAQVAQPTRGLSSKDVVISWTMPDSRGSVITKYSITFLDKSDSTYKEVEAFCGLVDSATPHTTTSCTIPMTQFNSVLGYAKGDIIKVKVAAYNDQGAGTASQEITSGLVYQTIPVQVTNLSATSTDNTTVKLSWRSIASSPDNGYSTVTEYEVWWDNGAGSGTSLFLKSSAGSDVTTTISGLSTSTTYRFAVLAKNIHGSGSLSEEVSILAAYKPTQMDPVVVAEDGSVSTSVAFSWEPPSTANGAIITSYRVKFLNKGTSAYEEFPSLCDSSDLSNRV
jgi:hypothetical protein